MLSEIEMEGSDQRGYTANVLPCRGRRGRPKFEISEEQLQYIHFTCPKIASLLGVSLCTVRRRMTEYGLSVTSLYSDISENDIDEVVDQIRAFVPQLWLSHDGWPPTSTWNTSNTSADSKCYAQK